MLIKYLKQINFFSYQGRIGRQTYIFLTLMTIMCGLLVLIVGGIGAFYILEYFFGITLSEKWQFVVLLLPGAVLINVLFSFIAVKRLHDIGWSGWFCLLLFLQQVYKLIYQNMFNSIRFLEMEFLILGVSLIMYLILLFKKGSEGDNIYGPDPLSMYRRDKR